MLTAWEPGLALTAVSAAVSKGTFAFAIAAFCIRFSDRHVRVEMIGDKPEETLLPALAGGAAELPIEPPLALASSERGNVAVPA